MKESGEMYLETILVLSKEKDVVRAIDISKAMGFSKASVSRSLVKLKNEECITVDSISGKVELTKKGLNIANKIYERHDILSRILIEIGVSKETAIADACKIEHDLSDETFNSIKLYLKNK